MPNASLRRFYLRKPDLDTVFTAFTLEWQEGDKVHLVAETAPAAALADPEIFCLECGGAGEVALGNFDHHNTPLSLPPACLQALHWREPDDPLLWDWGEYVAAVDLGRGRGNGLSGWTLSQLYSGLRLTVPDPVAQLTAGVQLLRTILKLRLTPQEPLPLLPAWEPYRQAKRDLWERLAALLPQAVYFETKAGRRGGLLAAPYPGVHGLLRRQGCDITVALGLPANGGRHLTIASQGVDLRPLLQQLQRLEPGWGGPAHSTILAAPTAGSALDPTRLLNLIQEYL